MINFIRYGNQAYQFTPPNMHYSAPFRGSGILCETKVTRRTRMSTDPSEVDCKLCRRILIERGFLDGDSVQIEVPVLTREEREEEEIHNNYLMRLGVKMSF
jgi:hypothetical protein